MDTRTEQLQVRLVIDDGSIPSEADVSIYQDASEQQDARPALVMLLSQATYNRLQQEVVALKIIEPADTPAESV